MTSDFRSNLKKHNLLGLLCGLLACNTLASSATIHEYTSGTLDRSQIYPGVSFKTPNNNGPWLDLTFNWFVAKNGIASPAAFGNIFLLTEAYTGTPAELSPFAPGYMAKAAANASGTLYVFDPSVTLQPDATYYFYADSFNAIFGGGQDPGTSLYATTQGDSKFVTFTSESPNFQLAGDAAPRPGALLPTPEPSYGGLVIAGCISILWLARRSKGVNMRLGFSALRQLFSVLLLGMLLMIPVPSALRAQSNSCSVPSRLGDGPPPPDFTNVTDILGGRRTLLKVDDIEVAVHTDLQQTLQTSAFTSNGNINTTNNSQNCGWDVNGSFDTGIGRIFNQPNAVKLLVLTDDIIVTSFDANNQNSCGTSMHFPNTLHTNPYTYMPNQMAKGDFNGDGYTDFAPVLGGLAYPFLAKDVNNPSAGLIIGLPSDASDANAEIVVVAAGDFDGDGKDELARFSMQVDSNTVNVIIYSLQPADSGNWRFVNVGQGQISLAGASSSLFATAGAFSGATAPNTGILQHQLLIAYNQSGTDPIGLATIQATVQSTNPLSFQVSVANQIGVNKAGSQIAGLQSARLDFFGTTEQAVFASNNPVILAETVNFVTVLTFNPALQIQIASSFDGIAQIGLGALKQTGLALGNFGQATDPNNPMALQVATVSVPTFRDDAPEDGFVILYKVDSANNFALTPINKPFDHTIKMLNGGDQPIPTIVTGDLQGRSLLLGDPTKLTVDHEQPRVVMGTPPTHVDWVQAADGSSPQVLNLSAVLGSFYTNFQTSSSESNQSSSQSTTSFTQGAGVTASEGYRLGNAAVGSVSVTVTESAKLVHEHQVAKQYNTFGTSQFDVSVGTGFDDSVWFNEERHNVYIYPVIGQTVCPADTPNCSTSQRLPLTLILSGPDCISQEETDGSKLESYQPVWEPGNVFSYPWTLAQLEGQFPSDPGASLLTASTPTEFYTDDQARTEQAQWTGGTSSTSTASTATNISWDASVSSSISPPKEEGGFSGTVTLDYNGSKAISTLNTSTTVLGASTGIGITKPGTFPNFGDYAYGILPFVFGNNPVSGTFDSPSLGTDIQTSGTLQAAFVVDTVASTINTVGSWWQGAYTLPDVALNHPLRWAVATGTDNAGANCIETGNPGRPYSCAIFNAAEPQDIWGSEFFSMKGLIVTPVTANGQGPQITQAKAGDQVQIQARVYNYSLAEMPAGSNVTVQFYAQPWNTSNNTPTGDSFLIENVEIGAIPGHGKSGGSPNWAVANTTKLDTAAHADQYLVFWVLVVGRDEQGNPLIEMPGHGLSGIPPTVPNIATATTWIQPYSNNLGVYKSAFYIAPQSTLEAPAGESSLTIDQVTFGSVHSLVNQKVTVSAMVHAANAAVDSVTVKFYDGDPAQGGKLFDVEHVAHIRANENYQVRVPFRPTVAGIHDLYIETRPQAQVATAKLRIRAR